MWTAAMAVRGLFPPACSVAAAFGATAAQCTSGAPTLSTRCIVGTHRSHYTFFQSLVKGSVEPFALLRYVDGERMILQGTQVTSSSQAGSEDKWWFEGGESQLGKDMAAGLKGHYGEPYFFAFASPADDEAGLRWYMDRTEATCGQITYANLWINNFVSQVGGLPFSSPPFLHLRALFHSLALPYPYLPPPPYFIVQGDQTIPSQLDCHARLPHSASCQP